MPNTLFMRLEGPMQAWGERARWSVRDTSLEPTKSGLVGLLGCALGLSEDEDLRQMASVLRLGVRCDRPGSLMMDYHTVSGGVISAEGKIKKNSATGLPETVVSTRAYLADASFLAAVQAPAPWIERLARGLREPVWPVYLGRKNCPPTRPVFEGTGEYPDLQTALKAGKYRGPTGLSTQTTLLRGVIECSPAEGMLRRDQTDSNSQRTFLPRYTREIRLEVDVIQEEL